MKKLRITTFIIILSLIVSAFLSFPVSALGIEFENSSISISREIIEATDPITNTFNYTITPDASNPGTANDAPTSASIVFDGVLPDSEGRARSSSTVDFSETTFSDIGNYLFNIKESSSSNSEAYPTIDYIEFQIIVKVYYPVDAAGTPDNTRIIANVLSTAIKKNNGVVQPNKYRVLWTLSEQPDEPPIEMTIVGMHAEIIGTLPGLSKQCFAYSLEVSASGFSSDERLTLMTRKSINGEPSVCASSTNATGGRGSNPNQGATIRLANSSSDSSIGNYEVIPGQKTIFKLANNEVAYLMVPVGTEYLFARAEAADIDYDDKYATKIDGKFTDYVMKTAAPLTIGELVDMVKTRTSSSNISFVQMINKDNVITGIIVNSWPFLIMILIVAGGAIAIAILNHRKKASKKLIK